MSNIISFEAAKAQREKSKLIAVPASESNVRSMPIIKSTIASGKEESLFIREAKRFSFQRVVNPPAFVVMNVKNLPPSFPPDFDPEPLIA